MRDPNTFDGGQPTAYGLMLDMADTVRALPHIAEVDLQGKHQTWFIALGADGEEYIVDVQAKSTVGQAIRPWNNNGR
jgi:hypothetical protein